MSRPIDRYERQIVRVLDRTDSGWTYKAAVFHGAMSSHLDGERLSPERLDHLVRVWCAVGGLPVPA